MPTVHGSLDTARAGGSGKELMGVRYREFDGVDDVSTKPIASNGCVEPAASASKLSKPGGGDTEDVIGGCLCSIGWTGYGLLSVDERVMSRPCRSNS